MIEAGANEIPEDKMIEAIYRRHDVNQTIIAFVNKIVEEVGKRSTAIQAAQFRMRCLRQSRNWFLRHRWRRLYSQTRSSSVRRISARLRTSWQRLCRHNEEWLAVLGEAVYQYQKKTVRKMILKDHKRPDGRAINQIRPLSSRGDLIPRVHGSAMFTVDRHRSAMW